MPFLAAAAPLIASALGATATTSALIGAGASVAGGIYSASQAKDKASQAANASQVNIDALNEQTKAIAKQNALDSAELERQLTPEVPQLRTAANQGIINGLTPDASTTQSQALLMAGLGDQLHTPLLQAAIAKAQNDLALGGNLGVDQSNLVTRRALAMGGTVAPGTLGQGRDLTARDLGLSSLQLEQQRLQSALGAGAQEQDLATANSTNLINKIQILKSISDSNFQRQLAAGQYGESIKQPIVGLDPSSVANITIGNQNAQSKALASQANIAGAQGNNLLTGAGQLGGLSQLLNFNKAQAPLVYNSTSAYNSLPFYPTG